MCSERKGFSVLVTKQKAWAERATGGMHANARRCIKKIKTFRSHTAYLTAIHNTICIWMDRWLDGWIDGWMGKLTVLADVVWDLSSSLVMHFIIYLRGGVKSLARRIQSLFWSTLTLSHIPHNERRVWLTIGLYWPVQSVCISTLSDLR